MQDFGFSDLRVVNEFGAPFEAAQLEAKSAVGAGEIMQSARLFDSVPQAIADCTLVAGTTAIGGRELRQPISTLLDAASQIEMELQALLDNPISAIEVQGSSNPGQAMSASGGRVALLFGSEKTGLTNEQLSHCRLLLTIPLLAPAGRHLSMNLGQAVAVCLYELTRAGFEGSRELPVLRHISATSDDRERLTALLGETMQLSDYTRRFPANARLEIVRQLAGSLGQSREEAATWTGLFKLVLRALKHTESTTEELQKERPA